MPDKQKNVTDVVSEETALPETPEGETQTQPLDAEVETRIKDAIATATKEATEVARREIQSYKDKARAEVESAQRKTKYSETLASGLRTSFGAVDPEQAKLAAAQAELAARQQADWEEKQIQARERFDQDFRTNLTQTIASLGVDPNDSKIDWAEDAPGDYLAKQRRTLESVSKIAKENAKSEKDKFEQRIKDIESKLGEEANSVDTGASGGASGSDKDFLAKWNDGDVPATKENLARAQKLIQ